MANRDNTPTMTNKHFLTENNIYCIANIKYFLYNIGREIKRTTNN